MKTITSLLRMVLLGIFFLAFTVRGYCSNRETSDFNDGTFCYKLLTDNRVMVTECMGNGALSIPSSVTYNDVSYTVTEIGKYAFASNKDITSITIPETVTAVDQNAFDKCRGLTSVHFDDGDENISLSYCDFSTAGQDPLFFGCSSLHEVYLGRTVTYADADKEKPFQGITSVKWIAVGPKVKEIPSSLFADVKYIESVDFTNATSLTSIGAGAFLNCYLLQELDLSNTKVSEIGDEAFCGAQDLTTLMLPPTLHIVGVDAFSYGKGNSGIVKTIYFRGDETSKDLTLINKDENNFKNAKTVYLDRNIDSESAQTLFTNCTSLTLGTHFTTIQGSAFLSSKLTSLIIPANVTSIGDCAFESIQTMSSLVIEDSDVPLQLGGFVFRKSGASASVLYIGRDLNFDITSRVDTLTSGLTLKVYSPPFNESKFDQIALGESVTEVCDSLFYSCSTVMEMTIGSNVKTIGYGAFYGCSTMNSLHFTDGPEPITIYGLDKNGYNKFDRNLHLTDLYLGRNIESYIGKEESCLLYHISELKRLTVGVNVTRIPKYMFAGAAIEELSIYNSNDTLEIEPYSFANCTGLKTLDIISTAVVKENAFSGDNALQELTFSEGVAAESSAFAGCSGIKTVYVTYAKERDEDVLFPTDAFENVVYDQARAIQNGEYNAKGDSPWWYFARCSTVDYDMYRVDESAESAIEPCSHSDISMTHTFKAGTYQLVSFPFPVSTYYFGFDAKAWQLDSCEPYSVTDSPDLMLTAQTPYDLSSSYDFPENTPLLLYTTRDDSLLQASIDLFEQKTVQLQSQETHLDKDESGNTRSYSFDVLNYASKPWMEGQSIYVIDDNYVKRVNSAEYIVPAFTPTIKSNDTEGFLVLATKDENSVFGIVANGVTSITADNQLAGYMTFCSSESNYEVVGKYKDDTKVYTVKGCDENGELQLHAVADGVINKGEAVVLLYKAGEKVELGMVTNSSTDTEAYADNLLLGVNENTPVSELCSDGFSYVMALSHDANNAHPGFYQFASEKTLNAHDAYIQPSALSSVSASAESFHLPEVTAIRQVEADGSAERIYDVSGRKVTVAEKNDVYIINNKKAIVK